MDHLDRDFWIFRSSTILENTLFLFLATILISVLFSFGMKPNTHQFWIIFRLLFYFSIVQNNTFPTLAKTLSSPRLLVSDVQNCLLFYIYSQATATRIDFFVVSSKTFFFFFFRGRSFVSYKVSPDSKCILTIISSSPISNEANPPFTPEDPL